MGEVVDCDPAGAEVIKACERAKVCLAVRKVSVPSTKIHRHIDDHEERQIGCNPGERRPNCGPHDSLKLDEQPRESDRNQQEGRRPDRILERVAEIVGGDHCVPRANLGHQDQWNDKHRYVVDRVRLNKFCELPQDNRPLDHEADLRHRRN